MKNPGIAIAIPGSSYLQLSKFVNIGNAAVVVGIYDPTVGVDLLVAYREAFIKSFLLSKCSAINKEEKLDILADCLVSSGSGETGLETAYR